MTEVGITRIQAILDGVLTSLGWQHETDDDGLAGGDQEYSLGLVGALRLRRHPIYLWPNGVVTFQQPKDAGETADEPLTATWIQSVIMPALESLGFRLEPDGKCGGVQKFTLPEDRIRPLRRQNIVVLPDGRISHIVGQ
jgi:hypothetical protein